ncbi:terminase [Escherichia phage 4E8]|nr:terminase [Escherichia phage 4E8]
MGIIKFVVKVFVGFFLVVLLLGVLLSSIGSVKAATFTPKTIEGLQCTYLIENYDTGKQSPKVIILHVNDFDHVQSYDKTIQLVNETTGKQVMIDHLMRSSLTLFDESMNEIASGNGQCANP